MSEEVKKEKKEMSRRQFLAYTLGGTGGFLAAAMALPMIRFAVDPLLQKSGDSEFVKVIALSELSEEPKSVTFKMFEKDGWIEKEADFTAWITKEANGNVFALSPICKHLGCTVNWNTEKQYPNQYYCPCHGAHYLKNGEVKAVANASLDEYEVKIQDDFVYIGKIKPNSLVTS
jgi:menaquinol-cytochrome c reductase iron-sulfur subunit